jgi:hypothetical protein
MSFSSTTRAAWLSLTALGVAMGSTLANVAPASARGCNGVVNQFVWGCAAWDNNNGPQFPNYVPPRPAQRAVIAPNARPVVRPNNPQLVQPGNGAGIISSSSPFRR